MVESRSDAAFRRSGTLLMQQRWRDAVEQLRPALIGDPDNARLWARLAVALAAAPDAAAEAEASAKKAMSLDPNDPEILAAYGGLMLDLGHPWRALAALRKATRLDPDSAVAFSLLARAFHAVHRTEAAVDAAYEAVYLAPTEASHHIVLAEVLLAGLIADEAMVETAREHVNMAMFLEPDSINTLSPKSAEVLHALRDRQTHEFVAAEARLAHWAILTGRLVAVCQLLLLILLLLRTVAPTLIAVVLAISGWLLIMVAIVRGWVRLGVVGRSDLRYLMHTAFGVVVSRFIRVFAAWMFPIVAVLPLAVMFLPHYS
ncbi:MAG: tetratricopeptide repeat protein [Propionibacteriaceae bacterium]|jgi:tetratricopeptide (TPR) repeat protein|nr:tetratricopeptide repeat protein [Propionibacteriaceae bacterium]